jgi:hypothetical protein
VRKVTFLLLLLLLLGCSQPTVAPALQRDSHVALAYTLFLDGKPAVPYDQSLREAAASAGDITVLERKPDAPTDGPVAWLYTSDDASDFGPPKADYIFRFGHGLSETDAERASHSKNAVGIVFAHGSEGAHDALERADRVVRSGPILLNSSSPADKWIALHSVMPRGPAAAS